MRLSELWNIKCKFDKNNAIEDDQETFLSLQLKNYYSPAPPKKDPIHQLSSPPSRPPNHQSPTQYNFLPITPEKDQRLQVDEQLLPR